MTADSQEPKTPGPGQLVKLAGVFYLLLAVVAVPWLGSLHGAITWSLFWPTSRPWIDLAAGAGAALLLLGLWEALRRFSAAARQVETDLARLLGTISRGDAVALAALSGFAEELFFRGAVQGAWGLAAATVLFALLHTGPKPAFRAWTLFAGLAGLLFGALALWRGNLLAAILAHFLVNAINLARLAGESDRMSESAEPGEG